jgi:hypothetical protein
MTSCPIAAFPITSRQVITVADNIPFPSYCNLSRIISHYNFPITFWPIKFLIIFNLVLFTSILPDCVPSHLAPSYTATSRVLSSHSTLSHSIIIPSYHFLLFLSISSSFLSPFRTQIRAQLFQNSVPSPACPSLSRDDPGANC